MSRVSSPAEKSKRAAECPDPLLSANLYLSGRLDEAVRMVALPFWRSLRGDSVAEPACCLWLMRYARRGEHLKLRIHGPEVERARVRRQLDEIATSFLETLPRAGTETARPHRDAAPPIDVEDEALEPHPDRTLSWTTYRRSAVSLGEEPLVSDDRYVALVVRCLSRATDLMLATMLAGGGEPLSHQRAQGLLAQALVDGLGVWVTDHDQRSEYLCYHRDWLLRTLARRSARDAGEKRLQQTLDRFNHRLQSLGSEIERLRKKLEASGETRSNPLRSGWSCTLERLRTHLDWELRWPKRAIDPFAPEPESVPLFKILHGLANQLGLTPFNEAFTHHLLLVASAGDQALDWPVRLLPARPERQWTRTSSHSAVETARGEAPQGNAPPPAAGSGLGLTRNSGSGRDRFESFVHADLLALCGGEARQWIEEFRRHWPLAETAFDALGLLRKHDLDTGRRRLAELETDLRALDGVDPSIRHFLWRWYFAALAYHAYLLGDLENALSLLDQADRSVCSAVGGHRFLLFFALHCVDFRFQRARIARRERRWDDVRRHLQAVREMWSGKTPFCRLDDGREIRLAEIREFCAGLPLSAEQRTHLAHILERADLSSIDQMEQQIHVLPDFVIPYP